MLRRRDSISRRASRVVHYDAPWTPMRLEQREGRALRLGSHPHSVDGHPFLPPPILEAALGIEHGLARKARLPALVGLGPAAPAEWTWRTELAARIGTLPGVTGIGVVKGETEVCWPGFTLHADVGGKVRCVGAAAGDGWMRREGGARSQHRSSRCSHWPQPETSAWRRTSREFGAHSRRSCNRFEATSRRQGDVAGRASSPRPPPAG